MNYSVIVLAAGRGSRTNLDYNKVFYTFENGQTVLNKSLSVFLSDDECKQVVLVCADYEKDYVNEHYTEKLSLKEVANQVGFSREYFCRFFKQHMGITFLRYLNEVRISHAGRILMNTDKSISEVMQKSGFTNQTIFNRLFKEIYGMTPRQARNNYAENTTS